MKLFTEGDVQFYAPQGDITKKLPVFYNPVMQFDRDLTVAVLRAYKSYSGQKKSKSGEQGLTYCDAMSGSGIRGLRAMKEAGFEAHLNDINPRAAELITKNLEYNNLKSTITRQDVNLLFRGIRDTKIDVIDIDPFGPFIPYLESALRAIPREGGMLCLTATDTAPLCGVSLKTCQRRYDAKPLRVSFAKEIGLRILIGSCARMAARYDLALKPLLCYNHRHYFRLFLVTENGVEAANAMLEKMTFLQHCQKCDWRAYAKTGEFEKKCPSCGGQLGWAGPLWSGKFADAEFVRKIEPIRTDQKKLLDLIVKEQAIMSPFYDLHHLSELYKSATKRTQAILDGITSGGHKACGTHFCNTGIRSEVIPKF